LQSDPTESKNFNLKANANATTEAAFKRLYARQLEIRKGVFAPDRGAMEQAACDKMVANGGFWGPWLDKPEPYSGPTARAAL
jgi:hypothetical protein